MFKRNIYNLKAHFQVLKRKTDKSWVYVKYMAQKLSSKPPSVKDVRLMLADYYLTVLNFISNFIRLLYTYSNYQKQNRKHKMCSPNNWI